MNAHPITFLWDSARAWNPSLSREDRIHILASALIDIVLSTVKTG